MQRQTALRFSMVTRVQNVAPRLNRNCGDFGRILYRDKLQRNFNETQIRQNRSNVQRYGGGEGDGGGGDCADECDTNLMILYRNDAIHSISPKQRTMSIDSNAFGLFIYVLSISLLRL